MKIGVCLVSTDVVNAWFNYDLAGLMGRTGAQHPDIALSRFQATGCELPDQREQTVTAALRAGCDACLFLDSDMRYPTDTLVRLLAHDRAVVAANYTMRRKPFYPVSVKSFGEPVTRLYTEEDSTGLEEVAATGMGVMLVRSEVLRAIKQPRFMIGWSPDDLCHLPEDLYFCRKLTEVGATIWIDQDLSQEVEHLGIVAFTAQHAVAARESMQARAAV